MTGVATREGQNGEGHMSVIMCGKGNKMERVKIHCISKDRNITPFAREKHGAKETCRESYRDK